ncbi:proline-rich transmembrane protein 4-like isoform X2 [Hypomesus transpacificus]|uniref:proline-rich transmembrane protein 4-like isoform X2 n=1 Tax=Hypomesus transpacificus TaxID=137520 RepID=UPI001F0715FF|nr:proline-rich transmembrane protein 4-like isoform X2 [Hypomesus transpacificus]
MLGLRWTLALCFWCSLLASLHTPASADEEAHLGTPRETGGPGGDPPPSWFPVKLPSIPSLPFKIPSFSFKIPSAPFKIPSINLGGGSSEKDAGVPGSTSVVPPAAQTGTTEALKEEQSGFGEEGPALLQTSSHTPLGPLASSAGTAADLWGTSPPTDAAHINTRTAQGPTSYPPLTVSSRDDLSSITTAATNTPTLTHTYPSANTAKTPGYDGSTTTRDYDKDPTPHHDPLGTLTPSTIAPETTVPTSMMMWTQPKATRNPAQVETTLPRHPSGPAGPHSTPQSRATTKRLESPVSVSFNANVATSTESQPWKSPPDLGGSEAKAGPVEERPRINTTTRARGRLEENDPYSPSQQPWVNSPTPGEPVDEEETSGGLLDTGWDVKTTEGANTKTSLTTGSPPDAEDWLTDSTASDFTFLPDCNQERSGICNSSDTWVFPTVSTVTPTANATSSNATNHPSLILAPPMFVPLHSDWNSALAAWGLAWEAHVYGLGSLFALVTLASALNLLCLPLRCPSGCGYFALVSLFLLAAGCTRAFSLLYDAYGHLDRLASAEASLLLCEAPFPCLTAAFGLVFLLLSMRSRMQLSYSAFQRPCFLACLVLLHFLAAFGPAALLKFYHQRATFRLFLSLVSRGAFVALASFLSAAYFVFYCYVRADSKHIYHLNNTSPTPAERYNRCPFAESRSWDRAAATVCLSALFSLACAGLQLYAMLHALGLAGGAQVFRPWPWWTFQLSCRVCEVGVCLTLALVVAQPVYCSDHLPQAASCWTELLAAKSPIIPGSYQWTLSHQEKLAICDPVGHGETECLPLYTLVDERLGSSLNGLDLLYHSNQGLAYRDLDLPGPCPQGDPVGGAASGGSSFTSDSTADLRPPSPINLRRSIDEALFSDALFPMSLFGPSRPFRCSDLSLNGPLGPPNGDQALRETLSADPGLYRTSSCVDVAPQPSAPRTGDASSPQSLSSSASSSPDRWRGTSSSCSLYRPSLGDSSLVLCSSPNGLGPGSSGREVPPGSQGAHPQGRYLTLGSASQESLDLDVSSEADRSVQEEFMSACRQIDALSVCSETIDL